jgi:hypothetical protein
MVAFTAVHRFRQGQLTTLTQKVDSHWRIDRQEAPAA